MLIRALISRFYDFVEKTQINPLMVRMYQAHYMKIIRHRIQNYEIIIQRDGE